MDLTARVQETIRRFAMLEPGQRVIAAFSGGADSVCLAFVLARLGYAVHAVHVHHGLRGEAADRDEDFCRRLCAEAGIAFSSLRVSVGQEGGVENAARTARYEALRREAQRLGIARIAVGHHRRDQAETVLMHLMRGSALEGLCGMEPAREDGVIRPLLFESREEIERFCRENDLPFVQDETNTDPAYTRNAVRLELLPMMERIHPGAVNAVAACAEKLRCDREALCRRAGELYEQTVREGGVFVRADRAVLTAADPALRMRVLRRAVAALTGTEADVFAVHLEALDSLLRKEGTGDLLCLPGGLRAQNCYGETWLFFERAPETAETPLIPGENRLGSQTVQVMRCAPPMPEHIAGTEYLDAAVLREAPVLRTRRPGDRITPLGCAGEKKLKDYLIDRKVPRPLRDGLLLVCCGSEVLAVVGMCVSERAKVTAHTAELLEIRPGNPAMTIEEG